MGGDMSDIIDGEFDIPEGHKVFASRRKGESSEVFLARAEAMLEAVGYPLGEDPEDDQ
jgi:hypothetical protein